MTSEPRYVSEEISTEIRHDDGTTTWRFVLNIYDREKKKSLRGVELRDQNRPSVLYECVESIVGELNEPLGDVRRKAEQRLSELNSKTSLADPGSFNRK